MLTNSRAAAVSTVGYLCLGLVGWMFSMSAASWFSKPYGEAILYPLVIMLAIIGVLAYVEGRGLDSIVFFSGATLFGLISTFSAGTAALPAAYIAWFAILWSLFFCYICVGSVSSGRSRTLFLLFASLAMLAMAIGDWTGISGLLIAGGYLGLVSSACAIGTSASEAIHLSSSANANLESMPSRSAKPMAAD